MKAKKSDVQKWSFLGGLIVALVFGIFTGNMWIPVLLFILGLIVGFLNIDDKEVVRFLVAVIALGLVGSSSISVLSPVMEGVTSILQSIVTNVIAFVGAAGLVVSVKAIIAIGKN